MDLKFKQFFLNSSYRTNEFIQSNKQELERLNEIKCLLKSMDYSKEKVQTSMVVGNASYTDVVNSIQDLEQEIINQIAEFIKLSKQTRELIETVKNNDQRLVLKCRYVLFMKWEDIAEAIHRDVSSVYRIHKKALENIKIKKNASK